MEGKPCCDPKNHPVPGDSKETIYKLLKEDNAGCGTVTGEDKNLAKLIDADSYVRFMLTNPETMTLDKIGTDLY